MRRFPLLLICALVPLALTSWPAWGQNSPFLKGEILHILSNAQMVQLATTFKKKFEVLDVRLNQVDKQVMIDMTLAGRVGRDQARALGQEFLYAVKTTGFDDKPKTSEIGAGFYHYTITLRDPKAKVIEVGLKPPEATAIAWSLEQGEKLALEDKRVKNTGSMPRTPDTTAQAPVVHSPNPSSRFSDFFQKLGHGPTQPSDTPYQDSGR